MEHNKDYINSPAHKVYLQTYEIPKKDLDNIHPDDDPNAPYQDMISFSPEN